jgi:maltodextrin utilization protein YvdJ
MFYHISSVCRERARRRDVLILPFFFRRLSARGLQIRLPRPHTSKVEARFAACNYIQNRIMIVMSVATAFILLSFCVASFIHSFFLSFFLC